MRQILKAILCALLVFSFTAAVAAENGTRDDEKNVSVREADRPSP